MYAQIISKIGTVEERDKILAEIKILTASLYEDQGNGFNSSLNSQVRAWVSEAIKKEAPNEINDVGNYLKELSAKLVELKVISLKIAFEPTRSSIDKFTAFIRKRVGDDVLLDFEFDPSILGGAVVINNGIYKDFSLKRLFDSEFEIKHDELMKMVFRKG
jgi:F0F1-type ATP synthase delta subunit